MTAGVHHLKTWPIYFNDIRQGLKQFECRKNDRGFHEGDTLYLEEFDPVTESYTGNVLECLVIYLLEEFEGLKEDYCIMGIVIISRHIVSPPAPEVPA